MHGMYMASSFNMIGKKRIITMGKAEYCMGHSSRLPEHDSDTMAEPPTCQLLC